MYDKELIELIKSADNIVFFGGAGVSTESGIPDFRGANGLYTISDGSSVSPEEILHFDFFRRNPKDFYEYYRSNMIHPYAEPNEAHLALARLEEIGRLSAVITQNIDGLHQKAGSKNVIELHGSTLRNYCTKCGKEYGLDTVINSFSVPVCPLCGGIIRPDVVLYGESLPTDSFSRAEEAISEADVLIVGGTSLTVQPAAGLIMDYLGDDLVIINNTYTPYDGYARLIIREPIAEVFEYVSDEIFG